MGKAREGRKEGGWREARKRKPIATNDVNFLNLHGENKEKKGRRTKEAQKKKNGEETNEARIEEKMKRKEGRKMR